MRYLLFAGQNYYPQGGIDDLVGEFESIEEAQRVCGVAPYDWGHIVMLNAGTITPILENPTQAEPYGGWGPWVLRDD